MLNSNVGYITRYIENNHPGIMIIPFIENDIYKNAQLPQVAHQVLYEKIEKRYPNREITITISGREALRLVLNDIGIKNMNDEVAIFTTSGNFYISSCVTDTIELSSKWIREKITAKTKAILVNHEFGYPFENIEKLAEYGLPIIEDCAFSFNSKFDNGSLTGSKGDYAIFSFSKYFPIQLGGFALSKANITSFDIAPTELNYIHSAITYNWNNVSQIAKVRRQNYLDYLEEFADLKIAPIFDLTDNITPGVFLFSFKNGIDYRKLKQQLWKRGIQCSVFYGRDGFFLPIHQKISRDAIQYIKVIISNFFQENEY